MKKMRKCYSCRIRKIYSGNGISFVFKRQKHFSLDGKVTTMGFHYSIARLEKLPVLLNWVRWQFEPQIKRWTSRATGDDVEKKKE